MAIVSGGLSSERHGYLSSIQSKILNYFRQIITLSVRELHS